MAKMPMLVVQVDPNFVSLNLYENGNLSFSRFASIDAVDYDNSEDYVYEAVNENITRMLQFHKSRNPENPIQNVIFYGDTGEYIRLTNSLESMEISTSLMGVPNNIAGYENIEFQAYANAIGAMFRSNKDTDRINLLETDATAGKTDAGSSFFIQLGGAFLLSAAVVGAVWFGFSNTINMNEKKIAEIDEWMNAEEQVKLSQEVDETEAKISKVELYKKDLDTVCASFDTYPDLTSQFIIDLSEVLESQKCDWTNLKFGAGYIELEAYSEEFDGPDNAVQAVTEEFDFINNIRYTGFEYAEAKAEGEDGVYKFSLNFQMKPIEPKADEAQENTQEEGAE